MEGSLLSLPTLRTLFIAGLVQLFVGLSLYAWGCSVAKRLGGPWWRRATWLPLAGIVATASGILYALWQLRRVEQALRTAPASEKASRLAEGISSMMLVPGALALLTWALCVASIVLFVLGSLRETEESEVPRIDKLPSVEVPPGDAPPSEVPPGEATPGKVPPGDAPPGEVPPGEVPPGEVPPGEEPPGERPPAR